MKIVKFATPTLLSAFALALLVALLAPLGCAKHIARLDEDKTVDLSGIWNDSDSRLTSEEMINDALTRPWVDEFREKKGRIPEVIVGQVVNKSHEHINTETFVKDLERALLNSGKVSFVASKNERDQVREEREDQGVHATAPTKKAPRQEVGADIMIIGGLNTLIDTEGKKQIRFYQVELEAIDLTNNRKVWIGQKKIKKYIKRAKMKI